MKIVSNLTIITVALLGLSAASSAHATGSTSSGCSTTTTTCDSWADASIYDMYDGSVNIDAGYEVLGSSVVVDDIGIQVSAWSDTGAGTDNHLGEDETVQAGYNTGSSYGENGLNGYYSDNTETDAGYGMWNQDVYDSTPDANGGWQGDSHTIDNFSGDYGSTDYDMVLFSFSEEVALTGASFSWLTNSDTDTQVSVVGLNDITGLTSGTSSWSHLAGSDAFVTSGSFQIAKHTDTVYVSDFSLSQTAQYWLVGAYNTVFGANNAFTENDDGFKLATLAFTKKPTTDGKPPTDVNSPNSFALLLLGGGLVAWRKRKTK